VCARVCACARMLANVCTCKYLSVWANMCLHMHWPCGQNVTRIFAHECVASTPITCRISLISIELMPFLLPSFSMSLRTNTSADSWNISRIKLRLSSTESFCFLLILSMLQTRRMVTSNGSAVPVCQLASMRSNFGNIFLTNWWY